jgi:predicted DNA-binding transcriptional regulator AlpA
MIMQNVSASQLEPVRPNKAESLTLPDTGFVRQKLLLHFVPFSRTTLWRRVKTGGFPAPVRLSQGITAWRAEDVRRWIAKPR